MNRHCAATLAWLLIAGAVAGVHAQEDPGLELQGDQVEFMRTNNTAIITKGTVTGLGGILTADRAVVNVQTGDIEAAGHVRIQRDNMTWVGERIRYNFRTRQMQAAQFRTGRAPFFAAGEGLSGDRASTTNSVYSAQHAFLTTDDVADPGLRVQASSLKIVPGQYFQARNAVLYAGAVPVFYFPFYTQRLDGKGHHFDFVPGYRNRYGAYLLSSYNWAWREELDGKLRLNYRTKRGVGAGTDVNAHLGPWGETTVKYDYLHDLRPDIGNLGYNLPADRQRVWFSYNAAPTTNFTIKSQVRYQTDERIVQNFFESEYRENPQPSTYVEVNPHTDNFSVSVYAQPRINEFFENVERLPDVRLTGFRQQVFNTPLYYESETSAGYYRRRFAVTNDVVAGANYAGMRADTFHQLTLPRTFWGWLNLVPRAGGRFTYYGDATGPGATTDELDRTVFTAGGELTFKASQTWAGETNRWLALDGLRHIIQPSLNYAYVKTPNHRPRELPQFDMELPSLRLLPLEFPEDNAIDAIDGENVMRLSLRNRLQTKRAGRIEDFFYWDVYTDWFINPRSGREDFSDLYSDLVFRPRSWITLESMNRYNVRNGLLRLAYHNLTLQPNEWWSWGIGHIYVHDDFSASPTALQAGNSSLISTLFLRANENWGFRAQHQYEVRENWLQQQTYSVYRDLRSWTAALAFRVREPHNGESRDFALAFTFSLKAAPKTDVGEDALHETRLLGY
ncbi:MAG TPA: LPS assembly protein LptD [Verrucomicrobiota bacterium]|nr:LPS assembly protein LptD [Verrucomicrobiota bacterium]HNT13738.1 LPS assembly protein LptD [Verrucomicrobiota bacterium]